MRLKTVPRQRRINYSRELTNITQDVNKKLMNKEKHNQIPETMQNFQAKKYELPGTSGKFSPIQLATDINDVKEVGLFCDVRSTNTEPIYEALNLSTKNGFRSDVKNETIHSVLTSDTTSTGENDFNGSLLFKIMTDPTFVETIKINKEMKKKMTCEFCKQRFDNYEKLQDHLDSRINKFNRITCCACSKTFGQKRYLRYHQRCHVMNNKFTCEICLKKYSRMDNLSRHKAYHTNPNKFPCTFCDRTFSRRDLMTKHLRSHELKEIRCFLCTEVFANWEDMETHALSFHTANVRY